MEEDQEQRDLVSVLYSVHEKLRLKKRELEADTDWQKAWERHTSDHETLQEYSKAMYSLATKIWDPRNNSSAVESSEKISRPSCSKNTINSSVKLKCRLEWVVHCCKEYFCVKEQTCISSSEQCSKLKLLDVGSCYNPFLKYESFFDVTAIDLCPAPGFEDSIFRCDFLSLNVGDNVTDSQFKYEEVNLGSSKYRQLNCIPPDSFSVVVFSYFLEYLADPKQRLESCQKAFRLLKPGGLLFILRPDSSKVTPGGNTRLIKMLKLGMIFVGFRRVYFEKLVHLWCMAFKKEDEEYVSSNITSSFFIRDVHKIGIGKIFDDPSCLYEFFFISQDLKEMKSMQEQCEYESSTTISKDKEHDETASQELFEELPSFENFLDE